MRALLGFTISLPRIAARAFRLARYMWPTKGVSIPLPLTGGVDDFIDRGTVYVYSFVGCPNSQGRCPAIAR